MIIQLFLLFNSRLHLIRPIRLRISNICTYIIEIEADWNVFKRLLIAVGLHEASVDRPELIELIIDQALPELIVIFLLHGRDDETAML